MKLLSSNENKIKEFKRILGKSLEIGKGKDLPEVLGNMDEVILYKSLLSGKDTIVEDTILKIDGVEVVDIRYNQEDKLKNAKVATWIVSLGYNDGENIYIYRGTINGIIVENINNTPCFGFDGNFLPDGSDITLAELEIKGNKDKFSARVISLKNLLNKKYLSKTNIKDIEKWTGKYQK